MSHKPKASAKFCLATISLLGCLCLGSCSPPPPQATRDKPVVLAPGIVYYADALPGNRIFHIVEVSPDHGHAWFVSPVNQTIATPRQHTLTDVAPMAQAHNLLVCMNATYFLADSFYLPRPGHPSVATALAFSGQMPAYVPADTRAVLFDSRGRVKVIDQRPPWNLAPAENTHEEAFVAVAGIGGFVFALANGQINKYQPTNHDRRTLLAVHEPTSRVWLAVFDSAGVSEACVALQKLGASHVLVLDGGNSTQMAVHFPNTPSPQALLSGYISPVATHIGLYASSATPNQINTSGPKPESH